MSAAIFTSELPISFRIAIRRDRVLRRLERLVFGSLLFVIAFVAIPYGTVEPWWISLYECAIFGLGALWIAQETFTGWQLKQLRLLLPLISLTAFAFFQSVIFASAASISADPFETRLVSLKLFALTINAGLLIRYTSNDRRLHLLIHVVIGVALASALFGIVRQAIQQREAGFGLPYLIRGSGFGQFVNQDHFAFLAEMAIGLTAGLMFAGAVRRERLLFYLAAMSLLWTALVLTSSRGAIFAIAGQILFLAVMLIQAGSKQSQTEIMKRARSRPIMAPGLSACLLLAIAVSAVWLGGDLLMTRLTSLPGEVQAVAQEPHAGVRRREVWNATWQLIKAHPITGSGFGAYTIAITKFHDGSGEWTPEAAHNDYLELMAAGGLLGIALVAWLGFRFIKSVRQQLSSSDTFRRASSLGALTGMVGVIVHNIVDFGLHVTANSVVFIALAVIATRDLKAEPQHWANSLN
jgi:O-antigen ligase